MFNQPCAFQEVFTKTVKEIEESKETYLSFSAKKIYAYAQSVCGTKSVGSRREPIQSITNNTRHFQLPTDNTDNLPLSLKNYTLPEHIVQDIYQIGCFSLLENICRYWIYLTWTKSLQFDTPQYWMAVKYAEGATFTAVAERSFQSRHRKCLAFVGLVLSATSVDKDILKKVILQPLLALRTIQEIPYEYMTLPETIKLVNKLAECQSNARAGKKGLVKLRIDDLRILMGWKMVKNSKIFQSKSAKRKRTKINVQEIKQREGEMDNESEIHSECSDCSECELSETESESESKTEKASKLKSKSEKESKSKEETKSEKVLTTRSLRSKVIVTRKRKCESTQDDSRTIYTCIIHFIRNFTGFYIFINMTTVAFYIRLSYRAHFN